MSYFLPALQSALWRRLRSPGCWVMVLAVLLSALALRWTGGAAEALPPVRVGVSLPAEGGEALREALEARESPAVRFLFADGDTVRTRVAASQWDCGLLFPEDFSRRLSALDLEDSVTLVTGPGSAAYPLVRETAAAVLSAFVSPEIARAYLEERQTGPFPPFPDSASVSKVALRLETLDGAPLSQNLLARSGRRQMLLGIAAAGLLTWTLFAAMDLGRWKETPAARRLLPCTGLTAALLPRLLALALPAWCAAALGLWIALGREAAAGLWMLPPYFAALLALALVLAGSRRVWRLLSVLAPFAAAASLALSPVFFDISLLIPALSPVCRYLPVTLYLLGHSRALLAMAAALGAAALAMERGSR